MGCLFDLFDLGGQLQRALGWKRMSILAGACPDCFGIEQVSVAPIECN